MEFGDVIRARHSVRAFTDQPVSDAQLEALLAAATTAPSWSNTQPYQIAVARGEVLENLRQQLPPRFDKLVALQKAPMLKKVLAWLRKDGIPDGDFRPVVDYPEDLQPRRVATGHGLYQLLDIGRQDKQARHDQMRDNFRFFNAPVALFVFIHEGLGIYSALDAGIFLQNLMLAATDAGLGTCAQGALGLWRSPLEQHFQLPGNYKLLCGLSLGYEADTRINQFRPERQPLSDLLIAEK